jgi:hypothetical protein
MRGEQSYRKSRNLTIAKHLEIIPKEDCEKSVPVWADISALRYKGEDPYAILETLIEHYGIDSIELQECIRAIGAGSSPWIQISKFLLRV